MKNSNNNSNDKDGIKEEARGFWTKLKAPFKAITQKIFNNVHINKDIQQNNETGTNMTDITRETQKNENTMQQPVTPDLIPDEGNKQQQNEVEEEAKSGSTRRVSNFTSTTNASRADPGTP